ncbi:MAG TPA: hypothetical protein VK890_13860 [Bacteroidia bacterium]|jgi:hypothetical protein|nr:hypothetical protein [Bacteroidia bacterium]
MKTKHFLVTGMIGIALAGMIITGCKKESAADTDATAAQDDANASFALQDSKNISDGAAKGQANERAMGTCGSWVGDSSATTDTIDIHFAGGCVSPDGRVRKGDIIVYWTKGKNYFDSGASITETWKNYSITSLSGLTMAIAGSRTLTNIGKNDSGDHSWSFNASLTLTYSGSTTGTATWNSNRTNVLTKIGSVWYYVITGGASGVSKSGVSYSLTINSPLYWTAYWLNKGWLTGTKYCDCFESGTVELTRSGKTYPLYLTFTSGVGNCAHTATATINGNNYNITLP